MIKIKYRDGNTERVRHEVEISDKAKYRKELMTEEYVLLTFNTDRLINFKKGDYIDTDFGRFEIVYIDKPKRNVDTDGGWYYEQRFHASWERWRTRKLFYNRQRGSEKAWSMTQTPKYFMQIVLDNLQAAGFGDYAAQIDPSLTDMKLVQFDGDDIIAGLTKIAEAWESEWWMADDVIHLSKCEFGAAVGFEIGDLIKDMQRSDGQESDYITRLYAFGSTRNIPTNYRKSEDDTAVIESVVERRLKLPEGTDHLDAWPNLADKDVVEGIAIFDEIYPRRVGTIDSISTTTYTDEVTDDEHPDGELVDWTAYRFKDKGIIFKEEYILPGEELRIIFQSGALAGMDFAVTFNPEHEDESSAAAQVWEIVRNDDYGIDLPSEKFHPEPGDTYVLYGYDTKMVSDILIPRAEEELLEEARKLLAKKSVDNSVYTCPTDPIRCAGYTERKGQLTYNPMYEVDLDVGQKIELISDNYFSDTDGYRISRVRAFEKRLDNKFNATYEVGETAQYSKSAELDEKMEALTVQGNQVIGLGGGVYLIKRYDGTAPSDNNAYSAKRANVEFLHRGQPDVANGLIKFLAGLEVGYYEKGVEGGKFDSDGNLEAHTAIIRTLAEIATAYVQQVGSAKFVDGFFGEGFQIWKALATNDWNLTIDRLTVRKIMTVYELLIQKIRAIGGQLVVSAGNGKIKTVEEDGDDYLITFEDDNTFAEGDLMRCQTFTGTNVKYYWVRVAATTADGVRVPKSEFEEATPEPGDECVLMGNTDNPLRQNCVSISATEDGQPRVDVLNGIHEKNFDGCLRARLGNLDGITDSFFPPDNQPHGDGLYADNVYLRGSFVLANGDDVKSRFEILEGRLTSEITAVERELRDYESYLYNAYFNKDMAGWETDNGVTFFLLGNKWIWVNDKPLANKEAYTGIATDRNRTVLYIKNRFLLQRNANFESHPVCDEVDIDGYKQPKQFYLSFFYRVLKPGRLQITFENANTEGFRVFDMLSVDTELEETGDEYQTFEATGLWNGTGDFRLSFSGEMYLYAVRLSLDRIADIEQRYRTLFEQTDKRITLMAEEIAETSRRLEAYHSEFTITAQEIRAEVKAQITDLENGIAETYGTLIEQNAAQISILASRFNSDGSLANTAGLVTTSNFATLFAQAVTANNLVKRAEISAFITEDDFNNLISKIVISADQIHLEGIITANGNIKILADGSLVANNGKFTGVLNLSTSYKGFTNGANLICMPPLNAGETKSMTFPYSDPFGDVGKVIRFYNSSPFGGGTYTFNLYGWVGNKDGSFGAQMPGYSVAVLPQETVEITNFLIEDTDTTFSSQWYLTNRYGFENFRTTGGTKGRFPRMLAMGRITFNSSNNTVSLSGNFWDGRSLSSIMQITREGTGQYKVTFASGLLPGYKVLCCGYGTTTKDARVYEATGTSFTICGSDDASLNDTSCEFIIFATDWNYNMT